MLKSEIKLFIKFFIFLKISVRPFLTSICHRFKFERKKSVFAQEKSISFFS